MNSISLKLQISFPYRKFKYQIVEFRICPSVDVLYMYMEHVYCCNIVT